MIFWYLFCSSSIPKSKHGWVCKTGISTFIFSNEVHIDHNNHHLDGTNLMLQELRSYLDDKLTGDTVHSNYAKALLKEVESIPELQTGIEDFSVIKKHETIINHLLADLFPTALTNNEIKAVTIPFQNFTFNYTERFKKIVTKDSLIVTSRSNFF